jgi:hypothetical protein
MFIVVFLSTHEVNCDVMGLLTVSETQEIHSISRDKQLSVPFPFMLVLTTCLSARKV